MDYHFKITFLYQRHLHFPLVYGAAVTDTVTVSTCAHAEAVSSPGVLYGSDNSTLF